MTPIYSVADLVTLISIAVLRVRDIFGIFEYVRQSFHRRCQAYTTVGRRNFVPYLYT